MPEKCTICGGSIGKDEDVTHCENCQVPYHYDCVPEKCIKCKEDT